MSKLIKSFSETSMNPSYKYIYILMNENWEGGPINANVESLNCLKVFQVHNGIK